MAKTQKHRGGGNGEKAPPSSSRRLGAVALAPRGAASIDGRFFRPVAAYSCSVLFCSGLPLLAPYAPLLWQNNVQVFMNGVFGAAS